MIPFLARHLICPLHERLIGRPSFRCLRELEHTQWAAPTELRELRRAKLHDLLVHARNCVPFYARRLLDRGVSAAGADPWEVLGNLPLLDKSQITAAGDDILWHEAPGGLHPHNTGGSTGEPLIFHVDRRRQAYDQAARARTHRWFGVNVGDREAYLWGSPIEVRGTDRLKRLRDRLFNHRLFDAFNMTPQRMDTYLDAMARFKPACLFGYPSSLALLATHAHSKSRSRLMPGLRAVFATGEVCYPHDREAIEDHFDVPVADGYGSREGGFIAHQCPLGEMHIMAENVIVEIIRDGLPVPVGETGEIVITHLDAYAMPFIRYRTGDRGRLKPGRCACGRGLPLMDVVQGRTTDFLHLPDGTVKHALSVIYPLRAMPGIRRFRVTQHEDFSVTIDVVRDDRTERITPDAVAKRLRPVFGAEVGLRVDMVDHIAPAGSGKYRYVVSHAAGGMPHGVQGRSPRRGCVERDRVERETKINA